LENHQYKRPVVVVVVVGGGGGAVVVVVVVVVAVLVRTKGGVAVCQTDAENDNLS